MPTHILRKVHRRPSGSPSAAPPPGERIAVLIAGRAPPIRLRLAASDTANRIWLALPLYGVAETWGECVHFEVPLESGRDRSAKLNGRAGEIYYWAEDDRIVIPFGPTPISRADEMRLPRPCNVWAEALDDVRGLMVVVPGEKVALVAAAPDRS